MISLRNYRGFSLIELIVCITIVAVLTALASPSMSELVEDSQRRAVVNDMLAFLSLGRQESVLSGSVVTLCPLNASKRCSRDWSKPLTLFRDPGNRRAVIHIEQIIRVLPPPKYGQLVTRSLSRSYFQYRPDGMIYSGLGNITWCPEDRNPRKAAHFLIRKGGSIRLSRDNDGDGIPENSRGEPVKC